MNGISEISQLEAVQSLFYNHFSIVFEMQFWISSVYVSEQDAELIAKKNEVNREVLDCDLWLALLVTIMDAFILD